MASRYWVGGTANWDVTAGSKWSTTSGGAGGAAVPTSSDSVFFDSNSGSPVVTITTTANVGSIDFTGYAGALAGSNGLNVAGDLTLSASMTLSYSGQIQFTSTTTQHITTHGVSLSSALVFNGAGGSWTLQDALTTSGAITLTQGTLAFGGHPVTCPSLATSNTNTRTLDLTNATLTLTGSTTVFSCSTSTNLTLVATGSEIISSDVSATAKILTLDGESYAKVTFSGSGPCTVNATGTIGLLTIGASTSSIDTTAFTCNGLVFTSGFVGTWNSDPTFTVTQGLLLNPGMSVTGLTTTLTLSGSAAQQLSTAGIALQCDIVVDCAGGSVTLAGDVALSQGKKLTLNAGTFDANNHNVSVGFVLTNGTTNPRQLDLGSGTWTLNPGESGTTMPWATAPTTGLTLNASTSTIHLQNATAQKTFDGGSLTYCDLTMDGTGTGVLVIDGSNTFRVVTIGAGHTCQLQASSTQTVADFAASGTSTSGVTLQSTTPGTRATLSKPSGRVSNIHYTTVQDVAAIGGAFWFAGRHSTNGGNTRGWRFMTASARSGIAGMLAV